MTQHTIAIVLNVLLPGVGVWYLNQPAKACLNFMIAVVAALIGLSFFSDQLHYILLATAAGSAGYAHAVSRETSVAEQ